MGRGAQDGLARRLQPALLGFHAVATALPAAAARRHAAHALAHARERLERSHGGAGRGRLRELPARVHPAQDRSREHVAGARDAGPLPRPPLRAGGARAAAARALHRSAEAPGAAPGPGAEAARSLRPQEARLQPAAHRLAHARSRAALRRPRRAPRRGDVAPARCGRDRRVLRALSPRRRSTRRAAPAAPHPRREPRAAAGARPLAMCGIAGYLARAPVADDVLVRMTRRIAHRGPDEEGFFRGAGLGLGFRRLAVIDLALSHQPMSTPDGALTIVFNGEIYNFRELRHQLMARGCTFATNGDTEVLLHAYREWGD